MPGRSAESESETDAIDRVGFRYLTLALYPLVGVWSSVAVGAAAPAFGMRPGVMAGAAAVCAVPLGVFVSANGPELLPFVVLLAAAIEGVVGALRLTSKKSLARGADAGELRGLAEGCHATARHRLHYCRAQRRGPRGRHARRGAHGAGPGPAPPAHAGGAVLLPPGVRRACSEFIGAAHPSDQQRLRRENASARS